MFDSSTSGLRLLQSLGNSSNGNEVENDKRSWNENVDDSQGTSINTIEVSEQTNDEIDGNNNQHDHEERDLQLGQERINFNRSVRDCFVPGDEKYLIIVMVL